MAIRANHSAASLDNADFVTDYEAGSLSRLNAFQRNLLLLEGAIK